MEVALSQHGEELLRGALALHPGSSPTEIVERALAEQIEGSHRSTAGRGKFTPDELQAWLDGFTIYSHKIPSRPDETFSRQLIYEDRD